MVPTQTITLNIFQKNVWMKGKLRICKIENEDGDANEDEQESRDYSGVAGSAATTWYGGYLHRRTWPRSTLQSRGRRRSLAHGGSHSSGNCFHCQPKESLRYAYRRLTISESDRQQRCHESDGSRKEARRNQPGTRR